MLKDAKSLLLFSYGKDLPDIIVRLRNLLKEMESGKEWDDNLLDNNSQVEWSSSPLECRSMAEFFEPDEWPSCRAEEKVR